MARILGIPLALLLVAAACGDSGSTTLPPETSPTTTVAPTTTTAPTTTVAPTTTTTATTVPPTTAAPPTTDPPGEPFDFWVPIPSEGAILGVIGVEADDTLNVRSGPNITFGVIEELAPTAGGFTGTGKGWQLPSGSVWWEIDTGTVVGWVNQRFMSRFAGTDDITASVIAMFGSTPEAETMLDLGLLVADELAYEDEEFSSRIVVVDGPTIGDLGEITIDVLGLADDSVEGFRLVIFGTPSAGGFSLKTVESTTLCQRGVSGDICV